MTDPKLQTFLQDLLRADTICRMKFGCRLPVLKWMEAYTGRRKLIGEWRGKR